MSIGEPRTSPTLSLKAQASHDMMLSHKALSFLGTEQAGDMHSTLKQGWEATATLKPRGQEEELSLSQTSEPTEVPSLAQFQTCVHGALPSQLLEEVFAGSLL